MLTFAMRRKQSVSNLLAMHEFSLLKNVSLFILRNGRGEKNKLK